MKITWLGQAGLMFETMGKIIMVDPYLSDSVGETINPLKHRRVPVDESIFDIKPDIIVLTHDHLDHTDPETLKHYLTEDSGVCVLAPYNAWQIARKLGGNNNYVAFNRHTQWTEGDITFTAVKAEHSDLMAIGVIIEAEGKKYYVAGDTLYNTEIFEDLPHDINAVFLPVNGEGNNMNFSDAKKFCKKIGTVAVPMHCGLFDNIDMNKFGYSPKVVPEFFKEINIGE